MSDIVWAIRNDTEKLESLFVRMREYATQTLEPLNIKLNLQVNESLLEKTLSIEARKEILLIYKEAVNNITKHSGADTVDISFSQQDNMLVFVVNDNGTWKGNGKTSGTGIGSMEQRAKAIGGKLEIKHAEKGTTLILRLPLT